jgi:ATP-dependent DNA helicase RecG
MTQEELQKIINSKESSRIELTVSTGNMDKFQEAICAFANDMSGSRKKGYLLIGVKDDGEISGLKVDDTLMKKISGIRSEGNILPLPVMTTEKVVTDKGDVLVVEVTPSFDTPVRYRGRTFIRIGPRRDIASAEEERILSERCAASLPTFDTHPCRNAKLEDIDIDTIINEYMPKAIDKDVLNNEKRPLKEQLASLHLFNLHWDCPTYAALIMFGRNLRYFMPGAYIQYVRFKGNTNGGEILNERRFEGNLYKILPELENFIRDGIVTKRPVPISILREKDVLNYPYKALRELMMNAVMHRDYQSNMPTRLYQYDHHIEIMNPGGLYGQARPENFPHVNDYRNSVVAEMMKTLNYVNMFNHGVGEVLELLKENNNPAAEFNVSYLTAFSVVVRDGEEANCSQAVHLLIDSLSIQSKALIISLKENKLSVPELKRITNCSPNSKQLFIKQFITPNLDKGLIERTHPENPHHPQQKYKLTELGRAVLKELMA